MIRKFFLFLSLFAVMTSCSRIRVDNPTADFYFGKRVVKLKNPDLGEISGMVASRSNPGLFWVHNDSGDEPRIFLIDKELNIKMTCALESATNRDWEDIAIGPGAVEGKNYLYIGDIGDNDGGNLYKYIYVVEEPVFDGSTPSIDLTDFRKITVELEGKKKDTETLLIDPITKDLYLVSKREEPVWLYKIDHSATDTTIARRLFSLPLTQIVGGDISVDGHRVLLKNYEHVYYWFRDPNISLEDLLRKPPFEVPYEMEPQGEAIAWVTDYSGFYTLSEKNVGKESYLYFYRARNELK
jgi:hypothetical protein